MNQNKSKTSQQADKDSQKKRVSIAIVIAMVLIALILVVFLSYQYFIASQTQVTVLEVEVEVVEVGEEVHITSIEIEQRKMDLLESPRMDSRNIFPAVRAKILRGQKVLSYDALVAYKGPDSYKIIIGFKDIPKENEIVSCIVWIYSGNQGAYADDQEITKIVWGEREEVSVIKAKISIEGTFSTASDANITDVEISQEESKQVMGNPVSKYPGVFAYAQKGDVLVSYIICKEYDKDRTNYTLYIGLINEPEEGEDFLIVVELWQREGEWIRGYYEPARDIYSLTYTWV
jgi:hypothetical protein